MEETDNKRALRYAVLLSEFLRSERCVERFGIKSVILAYEGLEYKGQLIIYFLDKNGGKGPDFNYLKQNIERIMVQNDRKTLCVKIDGQETGQKGMVFLQFYSDCTMEKRGSYIEMIPSIGLSSDLTKKLNEEIKNFLHYVEKKIRNKK